MRTGYSAIALGAMILGLSAAAAGMSQDRIPELQREARSKSTSATLTGCVAQGVAAGTYILTNITKDEQTNAKDGLVPTSVLLSSTDVKVSKHVGHRVSVTGVYLKPRAYDEPRGDGQARAYRGDRARRQTHERDVSGQVAGHGGRFVLASCRPELNVRLAVRLSIKAPSKSRSAR